MNKRAYFRKYLTRVDEELDKFYPSPRQVARAHTIINKCIFDSVLRKPRLIIKYIPDAWGVCNAELDDNTLPYYAPRCTSIMLNCSFRSKRHFIEVLAHEMVHQYQVEMLNRIDHGQSFWAWREKFKRYNLKLRISYPR